MKPYIPLAIAAFGLMAALSSAREASAQGRYQQLGVYGAWTVYAAVTDSGNPVCGMFVNGSGGRSLHIKFFQGSPYLVLQAFKDTWRIPPGTVLMVELSIDRFPPWTARGAMGDGDKVEWRLRDDIDRFEREFRGGRQLRLGFPEGNEGPWVASLSGSSRATVRFVQCMQQIGAGPTQPFGRQPPTQPHSGAAPAPAPIPPPANPQAPPRYQRTLQP